MIKTGMDLDLIRIMLSMDSLLYLEADAHAGGGVGPEEVPLAALPVVLHAYGPAQLLWQ
jgi:hypothetical protein